MSNDDSSISLCSSTSLHQCPSILGVPSHRCSSILGVRTGMAALLTDFLALVVVMVSRLVMTTTRTR
jgi:hypothetical protein